MAIEMRGSKEIEGIRMKEAGDGSRDRADNAEQAPNQRKNQTERIISSHSNRQRQKDKDDDRLSMYADDSTTSRLPKSASTLCRPRELVSI